MQPLQYKHCKTAVIHKPKGIELIKISDVFQKFKDYDRNDYTGRLITGNS